MGVIDQTAYGWVTPVLAYITACSGSAVALRSVKWALATEGSQRRNWLAVASLTLGSSIWGMHFVAMLGFTVDGMQIRYNVQETVESLALAVAVVAVGIFTVGYGRRRILRLLTGGLATGLGVAAMHYLGMAAMRMPGRIVYNRTTVGISIGIAVVAGTAALWATLNVRGRWAVSAASLVMGVAVCAMHYTGMEAVAVRMPTDPGQAAATVQGATAPGFIIPLLLGLMLSVFLNFVSIGYAPKPVKRQIQLPVQELTPWDAWQG